MEKAQINKNLLPRIGNEYLDKILLCYAVTVKMKEGVWKPNQRIVITRQVSLCVAALPGEELPSILWKLERLHKDGYLPYLLPYQIITNVESMLAEADSPITQAQHDSIWLLLCAACGQHPYEDMAEFYKSLQLPIADE